MPSGLASGLALQLCWLLIAAGVPKLFVPRHAAEALRRVAGARSARTWRLAGRLLGAWEVLLGLGLGLLASGPLLVGPGLGSAAGSVIVAGLAALTFGGFAAFVVLAIRRGSACGCRPSPSTGKAGGAELGRAVFLAALAATLLTATLLDGSGTPATLASAVLWAGTALAGTHLAQTIGATLLPPPGVTVRRTIAIPPRPPMAAALVSQEGAVRGH